MFSINSSNANPRPKVTSSRLYGEPVEKRHANQMARVLDDASMYKFLEDDPPSLERLERQYEFLSGGKSPDGTEHWLTWILYEKDCAGEPVGFVQATIREPETAHIAYVVAPAHWRKGYAREAVNALLDVVFANYQVQRAIAEMDTRNEASVALIQALGFRYVKTLRDVAEFKGSTSHEHVYEMTRGDWIELSRGASGGAP